MTRFLSLLLTASITLGAVGVTPALAAPEDVVQEAAALESLADRLSAHVDLAAPNLFDDVTHQVAAAAILGATVATHGDTESLQTGIATLADDLDSGVDPEIALADFIEQNPEVSAGLEVFEAVYEDSGEDLGSFRWLDALKDLLEAIIDFLHALIDLLDNL